MTLFLWELRRSQHLTNYLAWTRPLLAQISSSKHCIMTVIRHTQGLWYRLNNCTHTPICIFWVGFFGFCTHHTARIAAEPTLAFFFQETSVNITQYMNRTIVPSLSLKACCSFCIHAYARTSLGPNDIDEDLCGQSVCLPILCNHTMDQQLRLSGETEADFTEIQQE